MPTAAKEYKLSDIQHWNKSPEQLFTEGVFPYDGVTLLELRQQYFSSPGVRNSIHESYDKNEWLCDVVDTDGAKRLPNGRMLLVYIQRPEDLLRSKRTDKYAVVGGNRVFYECPADGFAVPTKDGLYHPEIGTVLDTVIDRAEAVRLNAKYIERHPEKFAGWTIPPVWQEGFNNIFKGRVDLSNPTPAQLAEFITSNHVTPAGNMGPRVAGRFFCTREQGPFLVHFDGPWYALPYFGARVRSIE